MDAQSKSVFKIIGLNYLNLWMIYKCVFGLLNLWKYWYSSIINELILSYIY
jgi:hypothetical protein